MPASRVHPRIAQLLVLCDQAFEKRSFHGTTLKGSLRGIDVATATWRPHESRHSVWEYLLHAAYWKYIVRRALTGDKEASFDRKPRDWPRVPADPTPKDLKRDIDFLKKEHRLLRAAIEAFPARRLDERPGGTGPTFLDLIHGIAAHDLYHCGQMQLVKRLYRVRP
jgi:hypothetical protein